MPFFTGPTDMDAMVDKLALELLATGAWVDGDAALPAGAHPARRCIKHATDPFWVLMERNLAILSFTGGSGTDRPAYYNEIKVTMSNGWDGVTHAPSGVTETTGIPAESWQASGSPFGSSSTTGSGNKTGQWWVWIDADGFALLVEWGATAAFQDYTAFFELERSTAKEYPDGFTAFFTRSFVNYDTVIFPSKSSSGNTVTTYYGNPVNLTTTFKRALVTHPFAPAPMPLYGALVSGVPDVKPTLDVFFGAYRSEGNSKVYFQFPLQSLNADSLRRNPITTCKRWFRVEPGQGLVDGDLVDYVDGATLKTFLVKTSQSPDRAEFLPIGIRKA